jgi:hypothetical protein
MISMYVYAFFVQLVVFKLNFTNYCCALLEFTQQDVVIYCSVFLYELHFQLGILKPLSCPFLVFQMEADLIENKIVYIYILSKSPCVL